jgi:hypothetical protein
MDEISLKTKPMMEDMEERKDENRRMKDKGHRSHRMKQARCSYCRNNNQTK